MIAIASAVETGAINKATIEEVVLSERVASQSTSFRPLHVVIHRDTLISVGKNRKRRADQ